MSTLLVYSTNTCVNCKRLEQYLDSEGVEYKIVNIDEDPVERSFLLNDLKVRSVPVLYNSNTRNYTIGYDGTKASQDKITELIKGL
jgi:glutaredoxin